MDGIALIFSGGTQDRENHIRILSPDGYLILYKKMASIWVENGQPVKTGTVLGEINQKMQFSIHRMTSLPWLDQLARLRSETDVEYPSIPFETQFCDPSNANECKRMRKRVDQMPCSSNETANKTVTLKADWRG